MFVGRTYKVTVSSLNARKGSGTNYAICFPANRSGSHVISNPSKSEKLVYLDFGTANRPDVVHFTGTDTGMVIAKSGIYNFKK